MSGEIFRSIANQEILTFWKNFRKTSAVSGFISALGIMCFLLAIIYSEWLWFLIGILAIGAGVYWFTTGKKNWSSNALAYSHNLNDSSQLKAVVVSTLLQNPTILITGFPFCSDIVVVFTVAHSFILQLKKGDQTEQAALRIKEEIKRHFTGPWRNTELVEPAYNIHDISAQCDRITSEYCTEPISRELAEEIGAFSTETEAVVLFGRPLPKILSSSSLGRTAERPAVFYNNSQIQLKHGLILVSAIILMAVGAVFINRAIHHSPDSASQETGATSLNTVENISVPLTEDSEEITGASGEQTPDKPEDLRVSARTMTSITLSWKPTSDTSGYEVLRNSHRIVRTRNPFYKDDGLQPGTRYTYSVRSYNSSNSLSDPSEAFTASTRNDSAPPSVPSNLTMSAVSGRNMRLTWLASTDNVDVGGYEVYRDGRKIGVTKETHYLDEGVRSDNVSYTVRAFDLAKNFSKQSRPASGTLPDDAAPSTPGNISFTSTLQSVRLSWSASSDNRRIGGYEVYREGQKIGTTQNTYFQDDGLTPDTSYNYTIRAFDQSNNYSRLSEAVSIRTHTDATPPSTPTRLKVTSVDSHTVHLTWSASTDNLGNVRYEVYRNDNKAGTTSTTSFACDELAPGNTYSFRVKAIDESGNASAFSNTVEAETDKSKVTIYFRKGFATPYLHYQQPNGIWTVAPGVAIPESEITGYNKITVELGYADYLMCAFSDGQGKWDPNPPPLCQRGDSAYRFKEGVWTFDNGKIKAGAP